MKYHGLGHSHLLPLGFLMRPLLNGGTLGGRKMAHSSPCATASRMNTVALFLTRHPAAEHPYLAVVHSVAERDRFVDPLGSPIPCKQLLSIYTVRARHLEKFKGPHGVALRQDVQDFCRRLETSRDSNAQWWSFRLAGGLEYAFIERTDTQALLGALRFIGKDQMSPQDWERLWHG